jgi:predicted dehydrogenase
MNRNSSSALDRSVTAVSPLAAVDPREFISRHPSRATANSVRFGVVGYGYWGPNIVRNLHALENCDVVAVCDKSTNALARAQRMYPGMTHTTDFNAVLTAPDIDAIAIVTPVWTHFELAKLALQNGKHVFVEKPFTSTSAQAE